MSPYPIRCGFPEYSSSAVVMPKVSEPPEGPGRHVTPSLVRAGPVPKAGVGGVGSGALVVWAERDT